jgi:hypothetical protein
MLQERKPFHRKGEKVVNPPQNPVVRNNFIELDMSCFKDVARINPNRKDPAMFIIQVEKGNLEDISLHQYEIRNRATPPRAAPKATDNNDVKFIIDEIPLARIYYIY